MFDDGEPFLCCSVIGCLHTIMQNDDTFFEEIHLVINWHLLVQIDHPLARLMHIKEVENGLSKERGRVGHFGSLRLLRLHVLIDLDALEGSNLTNMLFERAETTTHSHHDLVCLDQEGLRQSTDHELTSLFCWVVINIDKRKIR